MTARYAEFAPRADLADHVHCVWLFQGQDTDGEQPIAPDGRCELIVHYRTPYLERTGGDWTRQPAMLFAGQLTAPFHLKQDSEAGVIGVRFKPAGALGYLGRSLAGFTDRRVGLEARLDLADLHEADRLAAVQDHVAAGLARHGERDLAVEAAVAALEADAPLDVGLAPRTLQRRFQRAVGVSPRMLAAIFRFRRVFDALSQAEAETWTEAAQAAGYFDHPQMARDFRRFVGCTASEFMAQRAGLAMSLIEG